MNKNALIRNDGLTISLLEDGSALEISPPKGYRIADGDIAEAKLSVINANFNLRSCVTPNHSYYVTALEKAQRDLDASIYATKADSESETKISW